MRTRANAEHRGEHLMDRGSGRVVRALLGVSGAVLSIVGFVLAAGGLMSPLDGSSFYAVAGVALIVAGAFVAKLNGAGAWTYTALMAATFGLGFSFAAGGLHSASPISAHSLNKDTIGDRP
jgi:hypothetical protein